MPKFNCTEVDGEITMRDKIKIIPMTHKEIRAEFRKMDDKAKRLKPCGLSFTEMMKEFTPR